MTASCFYETRANCRAQPAFCAQLAFCAQPAFRAQLAFRARLVRREDEREEAVERRVHRHRQQAPQAVVRHHLSLSKTRSDEGQKYKLQATQRSRMAANQSMNGKQDAQTCK
eukprot:6172381-Pleurochrysis_carterae.AAC.5